MSKDTFTFKVKDTSITLQGPNIDKAMCIADRLIEERVDGYWKTSLTNTNEYTWTLINKMEITNVYRT
jgi:hypothetical protein|tara:strand:+ start:75 stop:278 length:204 start_codon:yes stop_codon:yes gene_type:complete